MNYKTDIIYVEGGIVQTDIAKKTIALTFTGHEYADGGFEVLNTLQRHNIKANFFFTGDFYRNPAYHELIMNLQKADFYLGAHSDKHILYCDWLNRDSILISKEEFIEDIDNNYKAMQIFGITKEDAIYFLPPFEWYNKTISEWCSDLNLQLVNFTPGTYSNADYTIPDMRNYRSSEFIYESILEYERNSTSGLNGFILLLHIGTDDRRTDKFYFKLDSLIAELLHRGYTFAKLNEVIQ